MAAFAVASLTANAQSYIGGTIGFSNSKTEGGVTKVTNFTIAPEFGTALNDQLGVGIALGFGSNKRTLKETTGDIDVTTTTFTVNPYLRYHALEIGKVNVFVDGGVYFDYEKTKDYKPGIGVGLNVAPGLAYNLTDKISIVAKANNLLSIGYSKSPVRDTPNAPDAANAFNANVNTLNNFSAASLVFGFYYNF